MAHKPAAIKHLRQTEKRTAANSAVKKSISYLRKQALKAVKAQDVTVAKEFLVKLTKAVDKAAQRNVIKKNTAARKKSRLAAAVNALATPAKKSA